MQQIHHYPEGESFVQHGRAECACKPTVTKTAKRSTTGRHGRSQGYQNVVENYYHNPINAAPKASFEITIGGKA